MVIFNGVETASFLAPGLHTGGDRAMPLVRRSGAILLKNQILLVGLRSIRLYGGQSSQQRRLSRYVNYGIRP